MKSVLEQLKEATQRVFQLSVFQQQEPTLPDWFETEPVRVAVNRLTGERIFLDPTDGLWRYLPTKEQ